MQRKIAKFRQFNTNHKIKTNRSINKTSLLALSRALEKYTPRQSVGGVPEKKGDM